jgi:phospholipid-translocating ATPase
MLETHHKSAIVLGGFAITIIGWWLWNIILSAVYNPGVNTYAVRNGFLKTFGGDALWWFTLIITMAILICFELGFKAIKRNLIVGGLWQWPPWKKRALSDSAEEWHLELWQELEQDPLIRARLKQGESNDCVMMEEEVEDIVEIPTSTGTDDIEMRKIS